MSKNCFIHTSINQFCKSLLLYRCKRNGLKENRTSYIFATRYNFLEFRFVVIYLSWERSECFIKWASVRSVITAKLTVPVEFRHEIIKCVYYFPCRKLLLSLFYYWLMLLTYWCTGFNSSHINYSLVSKIISLILLLR